MLGGAAAGAGILRWSASAVIVLAAALVAAVAATFLTHPTNSGTGSP